MENNQRSMWAMAPLLLIIMIDSMGLGLLFPILNSIIIDPHSAFLAASDSTHYRELLFGITISIFMFCWFFGAAFLGDLSDKVGRKKGLLISLLGAMFGYVLSGVAIYFANFPLLILGRIIAGFTAGSQPIAQAAIIDISNDENKTRNIGMMLLWLSLGFVLGPLIGGVLSDPRLLPWFNFSMPMYFAAILSLLNAILLISLFKETFYKAGKISFKPHQAIVVFVSAFQHKKIRGLSLVLLLFIFGWSNYYTYISMFLFHRFQFNPLHVSLYITAMAVGFSLGFAFLVDICSRRFPLRPTVAVCSLLAGLGVLLTVLNYISLFDWILAVFIGLAMAVAWSEIITLFSNEVGPEEQGWVMGVTGSIMALCFGTTTLVTGYLTRFSAVLPMWLGVIGLVISAGLMYLLNRKERRRDVPI